MEAPEPIADPAPVLPHSKTSAWRQVWVTLAGIAAIAAVTFFLVNQDADAPAAQSAAEAGAGVPTAAEGFSDEGGILVGDAEAETTVIVYEDFSCPHCKSFAESQASLFEEWAEGDEVAVEYRPIAFLDRAETDNFSTRAFNLAACVVAEDPALWGGVQDAIFAVQPGGVTPVPADSELVAIAADLGADSDEVATCITEREHAEWIASVTKAALDDPLVTGTPTVIIDGKKVEDVSTDGLRRAVEGDFEAPAKEGETAMAAPALQVQALREGVLS